MKPKYSPQIFTYEELLGIVEAIREILYKDGNIWDQKKCNGEEELFKIEDLMKLHNLNLMEEHREVCVCGSTDLRVCLPAVFIWSGRESHVIDKRDMVSTEFPIPDGAEIRCENCGREWRLNRENKDER